MIYLQKKIEKERPPEDDKYYIVIDRNGSVFNLTGKTINEDFCRLDVYEVEYWLKPLTK